MQLKRWMRYHWLKVLRQKDRPDRIAAGASLGMLIGMVAPPGTQMICVAAVSPFLRCNLVAGLVFTWVTNPVTIPILYPLALNLGEFITGLTVRDTIPTDDERFWAYMTNFRMHGRAIVLLFVGLLTLGGLLSLSTYYTVRYSVTRYQRHFRRHRREHP